jgi:hypothetical protein
MFLDILDILDILDLKNFRLNKNSFISDLAY